MSRRKPTEREIVSMLLRQGAVIPCYRCRKPILSASDYEREHLHEVALGGPDELSNWAASHVDCHKVQTFGSPSTTAGSSVNRIAKSKPTRADKFVPQKLPIDEPRPEKPRFGFKRS